MRSNACGAPISTSFPKTRSNSPATSADSGRVALRGAASEVDLPKALAGGNRLRLFAIGRAKGPERELFDRYAQRLRPSLELKELTEARGSAIEIKHREAQALLDALPNQAFLVALDEAGEILSSPALAQALENWLGFSKPICFAIGGAEGLHHAVLERADRTLSLGSLTWPHMLARVMLAEQLYRAHAIIAGHPYHRSGRP